MGKSIYKEVEVCVDVDIEDVLEDASDKELRDLGLIRIAETADMRSPEVLWQQVRNAVRTGDVHALLDAITSLAWDQAGVVIPIVGNKLTGGMCA